MSGRIHLKPKLVIGALYAFSALVLWVSESSFSYFFSPLAWSALGLGGVALIILLGGKGNYPKWLLVVPVVIVLVPCIQEQVVIHWMMLGYSQQK